MTKMGDYNRRTRNHDSNIFKSRYHNWRYAKCALLLQPTTSENELHEEVSSSFKPSMSSRSLLLVIAGLCEGYLVAERLAEEFKDWTNCFRSTWIPHQKSWVRMGATPERKKCGLFVYLPALIRVGMRRVKLAQLSR